LKQFGSGKVSLCQNPTEHCTTSSCLHSQLHIKLAVLATLALIHFAVSYLADLGVTLKTAVTGQ